MTNVVYVYGTLRRGQSDNLVEIQGSMYDLGWFPGVKLSGGCNTVVKCERLEVSDEELMGFDRYEGYREEDPEGSLYIRRPVLDGWIYEYNRDPNPDSLIPDGDWVKYKQEKRSLRSYGYRDSFTRRRLLWYSCYQRA